ncbi:MAG: DNA mismatch repair protein MutS [bacterium]
MSELTPMLRQYLGIKKNNKNTILFFRLGDFYEMFFEDAKLASRLLEITLTSRDGGSGKEIPMCGIPYHAAENYIAKLIKSGHKVAICEQVEDPRKTKGLVKREIVRTITPGTVLSSSMLDVKSNNYLGAVVISDKKFALAVSDLSTGEFKATEFSDYAKFLDEVRRVNPKEIIIQNSLMENEKIKKDLSISCSVLTPYDDWHFDRESANQILTSHFKTQSMDGFGCKDFPSAACCGGALLEYIKDIQQISPTHINDFKIYSTSEFMILDSATQKNLELIETIHAHEKKGTLLDTLDATLTPMGGRLLRTWVVQPLRDSEEINNRLDAVNEFINSADVNNDKVRAIIRHISDMERIISRVNCGLANGRDLIGLRESLKKVPQIREIINKFKVQMLKNVCEDLQDVSELVSLLDKAIVDEPPISIRDGNIIKQGFDADLDEIRQVSRGGKDWIKSLQVEEIQRTGIKSLKVRYNKVFGYYIEITKSNLNMVPDNYIRKQTLLGCERFITPELKEKEALVLGAEERINEAEYKIFTDVRSQVACETVRLQKIARAIGILDAVNSFALVAIQNNYVKPEITDSDVIEIVEGRHPVLERLDIGSKFVPNDTYLDNSSQQIMIITGPNMAGKSTYIRQVALIVLMGQIGSFVPARSAKIGAVDRIFTRVGASDELTKGQSTFMIEMNEVANILNNATSRSLVILDEVGRGTSTFDGVSIAWAVAEYIHNNPKVNAKTLFATHYHELTELVLTLERAKNYNVLVKEWNNEVIFLHKIVEGPTDKSYGIHVASLAGLPKEVIERAKDILVNLENETISEQGLPKFAKESPQLTFFAPIDHPVVDEIKNLDTENMTPLQALKKLDELKKKVEKGK